MATSGLNLDLLVRPLDGDQPAGPSLRYDPEWDRLKTMRERDPDYLPQGVWQRDLKRADWSGAIDLAVTLLTRRSKDLQIAAWLCEALAHARGLSGLADGLTLIARLVEDLWEHVHPQLDEEDGAEPRVLVLDWLDRQLADALLHLQLTRPRTALARPITLLDWQSADAGPGRDREARRPEATGPSPADVEASLRLTPPEFLDALAADLTAARAARERLRQAFDARGETGAVRLERLERGFHRVTQRLETIAELRAKDPALNQRLQQLAAGAADTPGGQTPAGSYLSGPVDLPRAVAGIDSRELAYSVLEAVGEALARLDPHSPAPYLARRAASFRGMSFADLLMHIIDDDRQREHLFRLMGVAAAPEGASS